MIKLSIIIPVYNNFEYLPKCIDSILNQTLDDIEIIIINDGSTDNSQNVINSYVDKYPSKIRAFYKSNGGLSSARNLGLQYVQGEYISFVDSDDWIEAEMYEEMFKIAKTNDSDIVCCGYKEVYQDRISNKLATSNKDDKFYADVIACNKIYRTSFWEKHNFKFYEKIYHEDAELFPLIFSKTDNINYIDRFYYCYNKTNSNSITMVHKMHLASWIQIIQNYKAYIKSQNIQPEYHIVIYGVIIRLMLQHQVKETFPLLGAIYTTLQSSKSLPVSRKIILFLLHKLPNATKQLLIFKSKFFRENHFNE